MKIDNLHKKKDKNVKVRVHIKTLCYLFLLSMIMIAIPARIMEAAVTQKTPDQLTYSRGEKAWLLANHTVRIRTGHFPPLMFEDKEGIRGMAFDYIERIFKRNHINFQYVPSERVTWPEALNYIKQHKIVDMVPTAKITKERKKVMIFTQEYIFAPLVIFTRKDDSISSIADLDGKTVSVEQGFVVQQLLKEKYPGINLLVASKDSDQFQYEAIEALASNKSDAYIGNLIGTSYIIHQKGYSNLKVAAPSPFDNHNQAMAIRNDWPELVSIINKTLDTMSLEDHKLIQNKWLSVRYEYGIQIIDILKWVLLVVLVATIILMTFLIWNRRLKSEIDQRKKTEEILRESENRLRLSMHAAKAGSWIWNIKTNEVVWDDRMQEIFGYVPGTFDGTYEGWKKRIHPEDREEADKQTTVALRNGTDYDFEYRLNIKTEKEEWRTVRAQATVVNNNKGERNRMAGFCKDITDRKQLEENIKASLKEKETLLQEIHHRVKNNMQVVSSLLKLQANNVKDERVTAALTDSWNRIQAMSAIHEILYQSENLSSIDMNTYLSKLAKMVFQNYTMGRQVNLIIEAENILIGVKRASPVGLIVNELISNSLKYAFPDNKNGEIKIGLKKTEQEQIELTYLDNGVGIPKDFDWYNTKSMGLNLVKILSEEQLGGSIKLNRDQGTCFTIAFKQEED